MATKIAYRTNTLERLVARPRDEVWMRVDAAGLGRRAEVTLGERSGAESPLSIEPPWRLVARIDGGHDSRLCQTSITIRDDVDTCLVAWSCLIDPTDVADDHLEALLAAVSADGERQLELLAD